jgi:serine/threonine protein kinase
VADETPGNLLDVTLRDFTSGQKVFNRYTLIKTLGRGGMGVVWLAHDEVLDRDVALKFLPEIIIHDRAVLEDLKRETKRSLELTHKNIIRIHDFVHDVISGCISMEYVEGDTLSNLRADKPTKIFEPDELKPWLKQLCEALDYAHSHARIIHRDLKPSNLMINRRGEVKVADFGIARSLSDSVSMLTHAHGTSGTLVYMSPQQLDGERGTHLDDIYSLGATVYELLTSRPPFYSGNIDRQIHEKIPPLMAERRKALEIEGNPIPENWEETIAACLAKEPARRPQSVAEVAERLELAGPQAGLIRRRLSQRTRRKALLASATAAAILIGLLSLFTFRHQPPSERAKQVGPPSLPPRPESATRPVNAVTPRPTATGPEGEIRISTNPAGATAILDGSTTITTPATFSHIQYGKHHLQIVRDGYVSQEKEIDLHSMVSILGMIPLQPRSDQKAGERRLGEMTAASDLPDKVATETQSTSATAATQGSSQSTIATPAARPPEKSWDRPHIYLQISDESQRSAAVALRERLQKSGYVVTGIQNVFGNEGIPTESSEIRFFTPTDSTEAKRIANELAPFFGKTGIIADLPEGMPYVSHSRQYEIWFSSAFH